APFAGSIVATETAAEQRPDAEHVQEFMADANGTDALGLAGSREVHAFGAHGREAIEGPIACPEVGDIARRGWQAIETGPLLNFGAVLPRHHEPIGARIREGLQQYPVDDAEDGGVAADANRKRADRDCCEAGFARQGPERGAYILHGSDSVVSMTISRSPFREYSVRRGGAGTLFRVVRSE